MKISENMLNKTLVGAIIVSILAALYVYLPSASSSSNFVTFDTHKFLNAQRVVTNKLLGKKGREADILYMHQTVTEQAQAVILDVANGAQVLSRQAVVLDGAMPDITDEVLKRLSLPTDVPDHNGILIKSIDEVEKKWEGWKPSKPAAVVPKQESPMDLLP